MRFFNLLCFFALSCSLSAIEPFSLPLWPEGVPGKASPLSPATLKLRAAYGNSPGRLTDIEIPEIVVYRPEKPNGTAVIVAPGGGYMFLTSISEGTQVCEWLNGIGVTSFLLKYRTPSRDDREMFERPVADALRAIGLVRHRAQEWGLDTHRVGLLGFSAGGNLLGHAACDRGDRPYPFNAQFDDQRGPDFGICVYGGGFLDKDDKEKFRPGFSVPVDAPPMFFVVAHDDKNNPFEAAKMYLEYKKLGIASELHVFTHGGHGFGMRPGGKPINQWPQRCAEWMSSMGYLPSP